MQINLLPAPSPLRRIRPLVLTCVAGVLLVVNLWLSISWAIAMTQQRQQEKILVEANRKIEIMQEEYQKKNRLEIQARQYQALTGWSDTRPDIPTDLRLLSSLLPKTSYITMVKLLDGNSFQFQAILPNMESVSSYLYALERDPKIEDVLVLGVTHLDNNDSKTRARNAYQFDLEVTMKRDL